MPVWAISSDEPDRLRSFRDRQAVGIDFLVDPDGATFAAFGILNERPDRTVPHPTVLVVDAERVARYVVSDENYRRRPPASDVVAAARAAAAERAPAEPR